MKSRALFHVVVVLASAATATAQATAPVTENFESFTPGPPPETLMVIEGGWGIVEEAGNKVLELQAEPVVEAAILVGPSIKDGGTIRAKIKAAKSRRAFPSLGVGLYGISGVKVRLVPAQKKIELIEGEAVVAEAAFETWTENTWWQVELTVTADGDTWTAEARVWPDGSPVPGPATLSKRLPAAPGQGRASLIGSPFANKPVHFDEVKVSGGSAKE